MQPFSVQCVLRSNAYICMRISFVKCCILRFISSINFRHTKKKPKHTPDTTNNVKMLKENGLKRKEMKEKIKFFFGRNRYFFLFILFLCMYTSTWIRFQFFRCFFFFVNVNLRQRIMLDCLSAFIFIASSAIFYCRVGSVILFHVFSTLSKYFPSMKTPLRINICDFVPVGNHF